MKNNRGFSTIELVVSFSICMVVVVILFQIVISLKELYEKSGIKTELLNKQNLIVNQIYTDINEKGLGNVTTCGDYCATFTYKDGSVKSLNYTSNKISYGNYTTSINQGSMVGNVTLENNNSVWYVYLPLNHKLFSDEDFGIKIVHYVS